MANPQPKNDVKEFNFYDFVDSLFKRLPKNLQTEDRHSDLAEQANRIIMGIIGDSMSKEDLETFMQEAPKEETDLDELIVKYLNENPEVIDVILNELGRFEQMILAFSKI